MIIEFRVSNYRSFSHEQRLSFHASSDTLQEPRLNRAAVVFGPEGSGKTNLLQALSTMRDLVLSARAFSEADLAARHSPFVSQAAGSGATEFRIEIMLSGVRYRYAFTYEARRVLSEQLRVFEAGKSKRWFSRRYDTAAGGDTWLPFAPSFSGDHDTWRAGTTPQSLFLTTAAHLGADLLKPLLDWFEHRLVVLFSSKGANLARLATRLRDDAFKRGVLGILRSIDKSVTDVRVAQSTPATVAREPAAPTVEFLYAKDQSPPVWLDSRHDSAGALWLILAVLPLVDGEADTLVAIDDFDNYSHLEVARFLLQLINDPQVARPVQVLLVSCTTGLLDLELLHPDQLWLMESDEHHASRLKALLKPAPRRARLQGGAADKILRRAEQRF
jgi:hypothetical protein